MQIVSLACKSCGAPLYIRDGMDYLACAHCGAQMHVERGGGAISLELVEAIRTGTAQTAAELALVRLKEERAEASYRVHHLEGIAQGFRKQDLIGDQAVASAGDRAVALSSEVDRTFSMPIVGGLACAGVVVILCVLRVWRAYSKYGFLGAIWPLIGWGILGVIGFFVVMAIAMPIHIWRTDRVQKEVDDLKGQIARNQTAVAQQEAMEQLPRVRAQLARIDEEIARNRDIVRLR